MDMEEMLRGMMSRHGDENTEERDEQIKAFLLNVARELEKQPFTGGEKVPIIGSEVAIAVMAITVDGKGGGKVQALQMHDTDASMDWKMHMMAQMSQNILGGKKLVIGVEEYDRQQKEQGAGKGAGKRGKGKRITGTDNGVEGQGPLPTVQG